MKGSGDRPIGHRGNGVVADCDHLYEGACSSCIARAIDDAVVQAVAAEQAACHTIVVDAATKARARHDYVLMGALAIPAVLAEVAAAIASRGATPDPTPEERKR